ncbi:MAG: LamG domain-containing protein [Micropruina sp.]|uniref:LamG domain-containing protein n=1 Tax=Micropruina sp. TaxID=2737536 RepID=UPI0039E5013E
MRVERFTRHARGGEARRRSRFTRLVAAATATVLAAGVWTSGPAAPADAAPRDPETVTAEGLPTWQLNGVVWSQALVGKTVYVTGSFTKARPPGTAAGSWQEVPAQNIFAYDITTGDRIPFDHSLNAQGLVIRASADGSQVFVGGDFTQVDGQSRQHLAAFDTKTGQLTSFDGRANGPVRALAFIGNTVYAGGNFRTVAGEARSLFASYSVTTGKLSSWKPKGDPDGQVMAMVAAPDKSRIIAGGSFTTINSKAAYGMGAIDAKNGKTLAWAANKRIRTAGLKGAITTLSTDGKAIYGGGYSYGKGAKFEGTFAANPKTGAIRWVNDCLGDTYDTFPIGGVLYSVGHHHDCEAIGGFTDTNPRSRWMNAVAERTEPVGKITAKNAYGWNFTGLSYSGQLQWWPQLSFGSYTGMTQAAWSVVGNSEYIALGGEFPAVNGVAQQGLVRFTKRPASKGLRPSYNAGADPVVSVDDSGAVRVIFGAMWDRDSDTLEYDILRNSGEKVGTISRSDGDFWKLPAYVFTDSTAEPGSRVRYQIRARDADGNSQFSGWSGYVTVAPPPDSAYAALVRSTAKVAHLWRLGETTGARAVDSVGDAHGENVGEVTGQAGALNEPNGSYRGTATGKVTTSDAEKAPTSVTVEAWVKTTSTRGGRIVGFGHNSASTARGGRTDRQLYLDDSGRPHFMINDGSVRTVGGETAINDDQWHHVVGTVDRQGLQLFVDGVRVARDQRYYKTKAYLGYWRIGADQTAGLASRPSDQGLVGLIDEVAVYNRALSLTEIQARIVTSGRQGSWTPAARGGYPGAVNANKPDVFWRLDERTGTVVDSSGAGATGVASASPSIERGVGGVLKGSPAAAFDGSAGLIAAKQPWTAPGPYSVEFWFKTTTKRGGQIAGFSSVATGLDGKHDRMVYLQNSGKLSFAVGSEGKTTLTSKKAYRDGAWHHVVATQDSKYIRLYVDSVLVGKKKATKPATFTGFWRLGGGQTWGRSSSSYFAGSVDEVAIYPSVLSAATVRTHYRAK